MIIRSVYTPAAAKPPRASSAPQVVSSPFAEVGAERALAEQEWSDTLIRVSEVDEPIHVTPCDPAWQVLGREVAGQVARVLRALPVDVAHIGSTAVPGLAAKPVIDIQVGCIASDTDRVVAQLRQLGFEHLGQTGGPGREYLRRRIGQLANIAVVERQGRLWADNIMFRDYLRTHPAAAVRYARAKLCAAEEVGMLTAYSALKAATVAEIMRLARSDQTEPSRGIGQSQQSLTLRQGPLIV